MFLNKSKHLYDLKIIIEISLQNFICIKNKERFQYSGYSEYKYVHQILTLHETTTLIRYA